ncbi:hypothetical protein ACWEJZ_31570 [Streptomyces bacillaris]
MRSAAAVVRLGLEQLLAEAKDITNPAVRVEILRLLHPANTPQDGIIDPLRDLVAELAGQPSGNRCPSAWSSCGAACSRRRSER